MLLPCSLPTCVYVYYSWYFEYTCIFYLLIFFVAWLFSVSFVFLSLWTRWRLRLHLFLSCHWIQTRVSAYLGIYISRIWKLSLLNQSYHSRLFSHFYLYHRIWCTRQHGTLVGPMYEYVYIHRYRYMRIYTYLNIVV